MFVLNHQLYISRLVTLISQVVDLEEDTHDCERLESILDNCVEANRHWYLARLGVALEQAEKFEDLEDILPSEDLEWCEVGALYAMHRWFVNATQTGKWVLAEHYADACKPEHLHFEGQPEHVQRAVIEAMDEDTFDEFFDKAVENGLDSEEQSEERLRWKALGRVCSDRVLRERAGDLEDDAVETYEDCSEQIMQELMEDLESWDETEYYDDGENEDEFEYKDPRFVTTAALVLASVHPDPMRGQSNLCYF